MDRPACQFSQELPSSEGLHAGVPLDPVTNKPLRRLEFVHIPKTGGTAIESEAARHGISWAICHFANPTVVPKISLNETNCPTGSLKYNWPARKKYHQCPWWHLPPQYFELQPSNPYAGADLFVVVRNPYDRLISEYYYEGTYLSKDRTSDNVNDLARFNEWIKTRVTHVLMKKRRGDIARNASGSVAYFFNAGHYIPQYDFVYEGRRRVVHHVLRFENLSQEFIELMKLYNLPLRLPRRRVRRSYTKQLGVYNLTRDNLEIIEALYDDDFREWGYRILSRDSLRDHRTPVPL
jgi:hypothetical protein